MPVLAPSSELHLRDCAYIRAQVVGFKVGLLCFSAEFLHPSLPLTTGVWPQEPGALMLAPGRPQWRFQALLWPTIGTCSVFLTSLPVKSDSWPCLIP